MRIFISYTTRDHRDSALAQRITDGLKARAVDAFYAPKSIRAGAEWKEVLRAEIASRCSHFLVILSAASIASKEVGEEINLALARSGSDDSFGILPLVTGNIDEAPLGEFHRIKYENDPDRQIDEIAAALGLPPQRDGAFKLSSQRPGEKGDLVPRLCDRREQEHSFRSAFNRNLKRLQHAPQIYFISGAEGEKHASLVERFQWTFMRDVAELRKGRDASVARTEVPWPLSTNLDEATDELLGELFGVFDSRYASSRLPVTPTDFAQLTANRPEPIVLVQHEIRSRSWNRSTAPLVDRYLKFWSDVAALPHAPQFIVFFNVVLCDADGRNAEALHDFVQSLSDDPADAPKPFWKRFGALLGTPEAARAALPQNIAVTLLPPLQAVRREDVDQWFDDRGPRIGFEKRQRVCEELFRSAAVRPMADVERRLTAIFFEQHLSEGRA
jgi:inactive STAND/TIR domain